MQLFKNNAYSSLAAAINSTATTLVVSSATGDRFPVVAGSDYFMLTLQDASNNIEIVKVTARTTGSDSMTITRAQEGTTARAWSIGDITEQRITALNLVALKFLEGVSSVSDILDKLGGTTLGKALFASADAATARQAIGGSTVGSAVFTAADAAAAREALGAVSSSETVSVATNAASTAVAKDATILIASTAFVDRLRSLLPSTTTGTLALSDRGCLVQITADMTIPSAIFAANDVVTIYNNSGAVRSLIAGSGLTLIWAGIGTTGTRSLSVSGLATVIYVGANTAVISGAGVY